MFDKCAMSSKEEARLLTLGDERQGGECNNSEFKEHFFGYILVIKMNVFVKRMNGVGRRCRCWLVDVE